MSMVLMFCGRLRTAKTHIERLESFAEAAGDRTVAALLGMCKTMLAASLRQGPQAARSLQELEAALRDCPCHFFEQIKSAEVVWVLLAQGRPEEALDASRKLQTLPWIHEEINRFGLLEALVLELLAMLEAYEGNFQPHAAEFTRRLAELNKKTGVFVHFEIWSHSLEGRFRQAMGERDLAQQQFRKVLGLAPQHLFPLQRGLALRGLGRSAEATECFAEAGVLPLEGD
jgi:tetratricopeptide (TPR) repeat protein